MLSGRLRAPSLQLCPVLLPGNQRYGKTKGGRTLDSKSHIRHETHNLSTRHAQLGDLREQCFHWVPGTLCLQACRLKPERALFFLKRVLGNPVSDVLRRQRFLTVKRGKNKYIKCINEKRLYSTNRSQLMLTFN